MANSPVTTVSTAGAPLLHPAWDRESHWALRSRPLFRRFSEIQPGMPTNNSKVVYLPVHKYEPVAANRHVVDEVVAADTVQPQESDYVRLTIQEHGHAIGRTELVDMTSYIPFDPILNRKLVAHMADTLDEQVADVLYDGGQTRNTGSESGDVTTPFPNATQRVTSNGGAFELNAAASSLTTSDVLSARIVRRVVARLRDASAIPFNPADNTFIALCSNAASVDLQEETGAIGWSEPKVNVDTELLYTNAVGKFGGAVFVEHPRARFLDNAGSGGIDVHQTLIMGREVLGEFVKREPGPGVSPVLDTYNRHRTIYWYGTLGFAIFRQEPLYKVETGASTGQV